MNSFAHGLPAQPYGLPHETIARQWQALHGAAAAVASLAGAGDGVFAGDPVPAELRGFPDTLATLSGARRQMAEEGLADLLAMLEPGLTALLAAHDRGADIAAPARTLGAEFARARAALVALAEGRV